MIKTALQIKTIGNILREKRKELKLEIKQISDIIKIRPEYLLALEEGNYTVFPSEVYLKGFLKNYSKYLGINTEKALAMYRRENEKRNNSNLLKQYKGENIKKPLMLTPNKVVTIIVGIAIFIIIIYLSTYVGKVLNKPNLELTSPVAYSEEGETNYKTDANFIELSGLIEIGAKLTINNVELKVNNFEKFTKEFPLTEGVNTFEIKAESQFGRTKTIVLNIQKELQPTITPTPSNINTSMNLNIEIEERDALLTVLIDGEKKTERLYKVGSTLEFNANSKIEIRCSNIKSLNVNINSIKQDISSIITTWELIDGQIIKK